MTPAPSARLIWHVARAGMMYCVLKSARPFIWLAERTHGQLFLDIVEGAFRPRCRGGLIRGSGRDRMPRTLTQARSGARLPGRAHPDKTPC
jgi:hypothetical protein